MTDRAEHADGEQHVEAVNYVNVNCPECGHNRSYSTDSFSQTVRCSGCDQKLMITAGVDSLDFE